MAIPDHGLSRALGQVIAALGVVLRDDWVEEGRYGAELLADRLAGRWRAARLATPGLCLACWCGLVLVDLAFAWLAVRTGRPSVAVAAVVATAALSPLLGASCGVVSHTQWSRWVRARASIAELRVTLLSTRELLVGVAGVPAGVQCLWAVGSGVVSLCIALLALWAGVASRAFPMDSTYALVAWWLFAFLRVALLAAGVLLGVAASTWAETGMDLGASRGEAIVAHCFRPVLGAMALVACSGGLALSLADLSICLSLFIAPAAAAVALEVSLHSRNGLLMTARVLFHAHLAHEGEWAVEGTRA